MIATFIAGGATVVAMIVIIIFAVIIHESMSSTTLKSAEDFKKAIKRPLNWGAAAELLVYAIHLGSLVMPAMLALAAKSSAARRAR
jgi:hypothetical protein